MPYSVVTAQQACSTEMVNKITIQATAQMAADKEAVGLSRVHVEGPTNQGPKCNLSIALSVY